MLALIFSTPFSQDAGVGQGYFSAVNPPGPTGFVLISNGSQPVRLVVTRWGDAPFAVDVPVESQYSVGIANIQTIGILNLGAGTATGGLSFSAVV